jgi:hypothetical protein
VADGTTLQKAELDARRQALRARVSRFRSQLEEDRDALIEESRQLAGRKSKLSEHAGAVVATSATVGFLAGLAPRPHVPTPDVPLPARRIAGKGAAAGGSVLKAEALVVAKDFLDGLFDRHEERRGGDSLAAG